MAQVEPGSPAQKAAVQAGDVIERIDGQATETSKDVQRAVLGKTIGKNIKLDLWRAGKRVVLLAAVAENPDDKAESQAGAKGTHDHREMGLELQTLTPDLAQQLNLPPMHGAVVTSVRSGSPADEVGVQQGDVIMEIDRKHITNEEEALRALAAPRTGGHVLLVRRGANTLFIVIPQE